MKKNYHFFKVLLLSLISFQTVFAQENDDEKLAVAVLPFTKSSIVKTEDVESIYGQVTEAFVNSRRFRIIERKNFEAIYSELEKQKGEMYMNNKNLAKQGEQLGANYLVLGEIGAGGSNSAIAITLKLVDVETSEIIASKNISSDNSSTKKWLNTGLDIFTAKSAIDKGGYVSSADATINSAGKNLTSSLSSTALNIVKSTSAFIKEYFPLTSKIVKIEEQKGKEAEKVLIMIGEGMDLKKGSTLYVYEHSILDVGGKKIKRKTQIGKLKLKSIEGGVSVCEVTDGGEAILLKSTNKNVYVSTNPMK